MFVPESFENDLNHVAKASVFVLCRFFQLFFQFRIDLNRNKCLVIFFHKNTQMLIFVIDSCEAYMYGMVIASKKETTMSFQETIQKLQDLAQEIVRLSPKTVGFTEYTSPAGNRYTVYVADESATAHKAFYMNQYMIDGFEVAFHDVPRITITPIFIANVLEKHAALEEIVQSLSPQNKAREAEIAFLKARLEELGAAS